MQNVAVMTRTFQRGARPRLGHFLQLIDQQLLGNGKNGENKDKDCHNNNTLDAQYKVTGQSCDGDNN